MPALAVGFVLPDVRVLACKQPELGKLPAQVEFLLNAVSTDELTQALIAYGHREARLRSV